MNEPRVVVYAASGYTGKLICWHLAEAGIPFIAAGRSETRLKEQMSLVPELASVQYECREVGHNVEELTKLFKGRDIVYNVSGPFMQLGDPVIQAALDSGCHYLDTTGETDWVAHVRDKYGDAFKAKDLLVAPSSAYMFVAGALAAEIALETPGIDTLEILYLGDSVTSEASTKSFLRMCTKPQYFLEHNDMIMWPYATAYDVVSPDSPRVLKALPWSGGAEPLWYRDDSRVQSCSVLVSFRNQDMFLGVFNTLLEFEKDHRHKTAEEQEEVTNAIGSVITTEEPDREHPDFNRSVISCVGRGNTSGVSVIMRGNSGYLQTAQIAAESCRRILDGRLRKTGFQSAAVAFGARALIGALAERGYHSWIAEPV